MAAAALGLFACLLHASPAPGQQSLQAVEVLKQLQNASLDPAQIYVIRNARLTRSRMTIYLNRGFIALMTPVAGQVTGAVFWGEGEILMIPPDGAEKRSLAQFTQASVLEEKFSSAYFRFTDQTAQELLAASRRPDPDDPEQPGPITEQWAALGAPPSLELSVRLLTDLMGDRSHPYFFARISGETLGDFDVVDDQRQIEPFSIAALHKSGAETFTDVWCSFSDRELPTEPSFPARALAYTLDVRINPDHSLEGRAAIQLQSNSSQDRVISFDLSRWLAVTNVEDDDRHSLTVIAGQPSDGEASGARPYDHIEVVLPQPHPAGQHFGLTFTYHGNVIADVGNGVLYVGARGTWYPNIDLGLPAQYDMTFHYPRKLVLVATGARVEEKTSDDLNESRWRSDGVFRIAGFNLGPYASVERRAGKTQVAVYATREAESSLQDRRGGLGGIPPGITAAVHPVISPFHTEAAPLEPSALLGKVADTAAQAVQYYASVFGSYPYPHLAISQAPGDFGQGWPELVYLPTLAFLPKAQRTAMGSSPGQFDPLASLVVAHEIAHQWWGNLLGWRTYHDQWLSEGLASYSAALFVARQNDGSRQLRDLLRGYKSDLLAKTADGGTVESGGPIWLGLRLSSSRDPQGYTNIVYKKACWVLHMLRGLMTDPETGSDARFFAMLRDFITRNEGRSVSTEDFVHEAERFMTAQSDLERTRKLEWFFNEWVYSTGIPTYTLKPEIRTLSKGRYAVQGTISQKDVSNEFEMPLRIVADYGREKRAILGQVVVGASGGQFRFVTNRRPVRVSIDEDNVLAVVR